MKPINTFSHSPVGLRPRRQRAFSFVEILFAIFILGIGFIMIAALFPVAIQQSQATSAETYARSLGISGVGYLRAVMPTTAAAGSAPQPFNTQSSPIRAYQISSIDPRFAWFPYYTTDSTGNVNRLIIVTMQKTDGKVYTPAEVTAGAPVTFKEQQGVISLMGALDSSGNQTNPAPDNAYLFYDSY